MESIDQQIGAARRAYDSGRTASMQWRREQLEALDRMLGENSTAIEEAVQADLGRHPLDAFVTEVMENQTEVRYLLKHLDDFTRDRKVKSLPGLAPSRAYIRREPLGTVLVIGPWNFPVHLLMMPLAGALAAGNSVVLKPSELAPGSSRIVAELIPRYLDPEAVQVVEGGIDETTYLLDQRWDHIFYTGSTRVGSIVMAAAAKHCTPVTLELGGKCPVWVDETFPLKRTARWLAWGRFSNAGQTCVAPDYVLCPPGVAAPLAAALEKEVRRVYGSDVKASPDYPRIINEQHATRLQGLLGDGRVAFGGEVDVAARYVAPTVLLDVEVDAPVMAEEIFGPILPIIEVADHHAAIAEIRGREKPLALYAFTSDEAIQQDLVHGTSSGGVVFGAVMLHLGVPTLPFGGVGASGMGNYHGEHSVRTFSHERAILHKGKGPDVARMARAPFTKFKDKALRRA
ncbi:MAG: aldehyde dehydrogenase family protein [Nocardioides sp.]|jgi:aldehyde dehydrogenase (NAD+)